MRWRTMADAKVSNPGKMQGLGSFKRDARPPLSKNWTARICVFVKRAQSCRTACITIAGTCCLMKSQQKVSAFWLS
uniref:Uncharacterized protein n=1 Tax=Arundo donax TaxID=35708 RepID=A0A0A9CI91_ARUDO